VGQKTKCASGGERQAHTHTQKPKRPRATKHTKFQKKLKRETKICFIPVLFWSLSIQRTWCVEFFVLVVVVVVVVLMVKITTRVVSGFANDPTCTIFVYRSV
jgi:hypothetical protein